jgi:hypothetical protein
MSFPLVFSAIDVENMAMPLGSTKATCIHMLLKVPSSGDIFVSKRDQADVRLLMALSAIAGSCNKG